MLILRTVFLSLIFSLASSANAATLGFNGYLNDSGNSALTASDLSSPVFSSDSDLANNVAVYSLNIVNAGSVTFESLGFSLGGIDPYFTLFQGSGTSASYLGSNYDNAFNGPGGDFKLSYNLLAGHYMFTLGTFANMSFAENNPITGALADGFTGLGTANGLGADQHFSYYSLNIETPDVSTVPEPSSLLLYACGLSYLVLRKRSKKISSQYAA